MNARFYSILQVISQLGASYAIQRATGSFAYSMAMFFALEYINASICRHQ